MKLYEQFKEMKRRIVLSKDDLADLDEIYETIGDIDPKNRNFKTLKNRVRIDGILSKRSESSCKEVAGTFWQKPF
jgi:hypothetical protein